MLGLEDVTQFLASETGLATISTTQIDGRVLSSIANCGVIQNPLTGSDCVALVSAGRAARLDHVRRGSEVTIAVRRGWNWLAVTGKADLIGPSDPASGFDAEALRLLLREIYETSSDHPTLLLALMPKLSDCFFVKFIKLPVADTTISTSTTDRWLKMAGLPC